LLKLSYHSGIIPEIRQYPFLKPLCSLHPHAAAAAQAGGELLLIAGVTPPRIFLAPYSCPQADDHTGGNNHSKKIGKLW
jgi:hypothetical protein